MKTKKKMKRFWAIAAAVLAIVLLLIGYFAYVTKYRISEIDTSVSDDGSYEIFFQSIGEPDFPFGASHARLVLKHDGKTVTKYRFDVANDGKTLSPGSWSVSWTQDSVEVTVRGEEQSDAHYTFCFDGRTEITQSDTP